jgi:diguanylate cyclase (GGDEF)-like protein
MLDIDYFKHINDRYGHQKGDEVLVTFVSRLQSELRQSDQLGRYGGEEFLVLLPDTSKSDAEKIAQRLRHAIADTPFQINDEVLDVTTSIGLACLEADVSLGQDELVGRADVALYLAKQTGRNRVVCWNDEMAH